MLVRYSFYYQLKCLIKMDLLKKARTFLIGLESFLLFGNILMPHMSFTGLP